MELLAANRAGVQDHLRRLGWIGAGETVDSLEIPGEGNMNRTLRARVAGDGRARPLILKQALPYVAKYPQIPAPVERLTAEAAFYRAIADCDALVRRTPTLLGEDPDAHLLCLEDLGESGDLTRLYADGVGAGDAVTVAALLDWLGTLHGLVVDAAAVPDNRAMRELNHAHIFEVPFAADNGVPLAPELRDEQIRLASDRALRRRARDLGEHYLGSRAGAARALLHGDFYPGSWLEQPKRGVAVIDPEFAFLGPPEFDVGVFTAHLLMTGQAGAELDGIPPGYRAPAGFSAELARGFAAIEVIRRLLGVAQLPLGADTATKLIWLNRAREAMIS